jgi:hypothetical protein
MVVISEPSKHQPAQPTKPGQKDDKPYKYGPATMWGGPRMPPKFRFKAVLKGSGSGQSVELQSVEGATWDDTNVILGGTLTMREPFFKRRGNFSALDQGDEVICECTDLSGAWVEAWRMNVFKPQMSIADGVRSFDLVNDMDRLRQSADNFSYIKNKKHPKGWYIHEIIQDVCRRYDVPVAAMYKSKIRLPGYKQQNQTPLDFIRGLLLKEYKDKAGGHRRIILRYWKGSLSTPTGTSGPGGFGLWVIPLVRSPDLRALGPTLIEAQYSSSFVPEFATELDIHSVAPKVTGGGKKDTRNWLGSDPDDPFLKDVTLEEAKRKYGMVHKIVYSPYAKSVAELRAEARAYLQAATKPVKELTLTLPGIPWIKRGDALQLAFGPKGLFGQVVFVKEINHTLTTQQYTMVITVMFDDPYVDRYFDEILYRLKGTREEAEGARPPDWPDSGQKGDKEPEDIFPLPSWAQSGLTGLTTDPGTTSQPKQPFGPQNPNPGAFG